MSVLTDDGEREGKRNVSKPRILGTFFVKGMWTLILMVQKHAKPSHCSEMQQKDPQACTRPCFMEHKHPGSDALEGSTYCSSMDVCGVSAKAGAGCAGTIGKYTLQASRLCSLLSLW